MLSACRFENQIRQLQSHYDLLQGKKNDEIAQLQRALIEMVQSKDELEASSKVRVQLLSQQLSTASSNSATAEEARVTILHLEEDLLRTKSQLEVVHRDLASVSSKSESKQAQVIRIIGLVGVMIK